ncbi:MAG: hypothetical protein AAF799_30090 [Myxococcota bacterium]
MREREFEILIRHGRIPLPPAGPEPLGRAALATLAANITHYGYALTHDGFVALSQASAADVEQWWATVELALVTITCEDKDMGAHVVYKNFPAEVLEMSESEYWFNQICMYWGMPNEWFTTPAKPREPLDEKIKLKVLHGATADALNEIYRGLLRLPARWTPDQWGEVRDLVPHCHRAVTEAPPFKENFVRLSAALVDHGVQPEVSTATDVLRLAIAMSEGDISMAENTTLRCLSRKQRRALLHALEHADNLDEDVARRREHFKRLFRALRPGDYAARFPRGVSIYDRLYRGAPIETFDAKLERLLAARDSAVLPVLAQRPGVFMRRLHHCIQLFGSDAVEAFGAVMPKLTTVQLLKLLGVFRTDHTRKFRTFAPRSNWAKLQTRPADRRRRLSEALRTPLVTALETTIARRVKAKVPEVQLDPRTRWIKLQTSDSDLSPYGRGTRFPLPAKTKFIRTASYWESGPTHRNLWYDNSWSFFDDQWKPMGVCCWNHTRFLGDAAIFSGDPTNSKSLKGRACQLIDLYPGELARAKVRYAVWNILCYSHKTFNDAVEVLASLQWGANPLKGKLFEPARCQLSFQLRGDNLTKYVAYLDVRERQMVYMDANLWGNVQSAGGSTKVLSAMMPAFVEYLDTLPSVHDLFAGVPRGKSGMPVAYDDGKLSLSGERAYVFRTINQGSRFSAFDTHELLG